MKGIKFSTSLLASGLMLAALTQGCVSEAPFGESDGEGTLRMHLVVNSTITRSTPEDLDVLKQNCVVYISGQDGLLYKYQGLDKVPQELNLRSGSYKAEAWTGDSVTASFDHKFYRGYAPFNITSNSNTQVVLTCRIGNVVVSVNPETIDEEMMKNWKITVSNSRGSLDFTADNMNDAKGYFMMPDCDILKGDNGVNITDSDGWALYTNLKYRIEGTNAAGKAFVKEGLIGGTKGEGVVERAHEYRLNLEYNPEYDDMGGGFITVKVNDTEDLVTEEVTLLSRPSIKGVTFEIEKQLVGGEGLFDEHIVKVSGFGDLTDIIVHSDDWQELGWPTNQFNTKTAVSDVEAAFKTLGISWENRRKEERDLAISYIFFGKDYLNTLKERPDQYVISITANDKYGKTFTQDMRIAVGEGAVIEEDPVVADAVAPGTYLDILTHQATLTYSVNEDVSNAGIEYREQGTANPWTFVKGVKTRAMEKYSVTITGLKPNTPYDYRAAADDFHSTDIKSFTTEGVFTIPEGGMEAWAQHTDKAWFPGTDYSKNFWDSGNHGSVSFGTTMLTEKSTDVKHNGSASARLTSKFVGIGTFIGKFAAGNLFVGKFGQTVSTDGAILQFGQPYDGSHPSELSVWVNYRPVKVTHTDKSVPQLTTSDMDQGQIFVAFATAPSDLNTAKGVYFDPNASNIIAYGEKTWAGGETCGADGQMEEVRIPIKWYDSAKTKKPTHIIIVCSASKYGDYFVGGNGSVMYLDDFELIY